MTVRPKKKPFPTTPADDPETLRRFFTLAPDDLELVAQVRGDAHRLALAVQLVWTRAERILLADPRSAPREVIAFVSEQLELAPALLADYKSWPATRATDGALIRAHLQIRPFQAEDADLLGAYIQTKAAHTGNSAALLDAAEDWLLREGVLRPTGSTTLERVIFQARHAAEEALFTQVGSDLPTATRDLLDTLCHTDSGDSLLAQLAVPSRAPSAAAIGEECRRLHQVREFLPAQIAWGVITANRRRQWAAGTSRYSAQALRRFKPAKRYTLLLAFLTVRAEELTDAIVEMLDTLIGKVFARSEQAFADTKLEQIAAYNASARLFGKVAAVLLDTTIEEKGVREAVFKQVPRERLEKLYEQGKSLEQTDTATFFAILDTRFPYVREFIPTVLETLTFGSPRPNNDLLKALELLRTMNSEGRKKVPETAPMSFVPTRWRKLVEQGDSIDRHAWELCLLSETRAALRAGDLTVTGSRRYTPWDNGLYQPAAWQERRAGWLEERAVPADGRAYVTAAREQLHTLTQEVARRLPDNTGTRIEKGRIVITSLDRVELPEGARAARHRLTRKFTSIPLPELLMEVDRWTGFSTALYHLGARRAPTAEHMAAHRPALFAVLVAEATNLGLATMATASGIPLSQLTRVYDWYFREETLRPAITRLIEYHQTLPLTLRFGSGTTSSSDGIRFGVAASTLNARHNPRYFGRRQGVTVYSHVSNQGSQFWIDVVNCLVRESTYVLDGLLYQDTLPLLEHYTDTAGFTELIFGLFELLGFRFAPRLRDLPDQVLYRAQRDADYGVLDPLLRHNLREDVIVQHWDELNRLAASLKDGRVVPSLIVAKLQALPRQNPTQRALQELGRLAKTRHILTFADDREFRRRVLLGLNKGETLNSMARAIAFGQQGRFPDRGYEAQLNRATALSLVINAIIVWNTRYLGKAATELDQEGRAVPDDAWAHLSPMLWEHIHLVGTYRFDEPVITGELRPLRKS